MIAVVSDTSPLHYLVECEVIEILPALFQQILIPPVVLSELRHVGAPPRVKTWAESFPGWVRVQAPMVVDDSLNVDEGEKQAICLAREVNTFAILMDDRRGRIEAARCGLRVTGTIGVLEAAAGRGLIDFQIVARRLKRTNARLDDGMIQAALARLRR